MTCLTRLILAAAALLLAACTTQPTAEPVATQSKPAQAKEEYVYRTSVGSRIPRKVKKTQAATSAETTDRSQRWLADAQESGVPPVSDSSLGR